MKSNVLPMVLLCLLRQAPSVSPVLTVNMADIILLTKASCVVVGLDHSVLDKLELLQQVFAVTGKVVVGILKEEAEIFSSSLSKKEYREHSQIVIFSVIKPDLTCLLGVPIHQPVPISVPLGMNVENLVAFINSNCHCFVNVSGGLTEVGIKREQILRNLYRVSAEDSNFMKSSNNDLCERRDTVPSWNEFYHDYLAKSKPFVIRNIVKRWPAFKLWSNDYLRQKYGSSKVHIKLTADGVFEGCDSASLFSNFNEFYVPPQVKAKLAFPDLVVIRPATLDISFSSFLDLMSKNSQNLSAYLEYSSIREHFPMLEKDIMHFPFMHHLELSSINMWLSSGNTLGKLHFDPFDNILCQVSGMKELVLYNPHNSYNLYEGHIQEAVLSYDHSNGKFHYDKLLDSTSMVMSPVNILKPDLTRFANFTYAKSLKCVLSEGDALFMPAFWWHEVQSYPSSQARNLAVNFWYEPFLTKDFPCKDCKLDINPKYYALLDMF